MVHLCVGKGVGRRWVVRPDCRERFGRQFHRLEVPRLENATGETLGAGICTHGAPTDLLFDLDGLFSYDFQCFLGFHAFPMFTIFIPLVIACRSRMSDSERLNKHSVSQSMSVKNHSECQISSVRTSITLVLACRSTMSELNALRSIRLVIACRSRMLDLDRLNKHSVSNSMSDKNANPMKFNANPWKFNPMIGQDANICKRGETLDAGICARTTQDTHEKLKANKANRVKRRTEIISKKTTKISPF